ncbi:MAG: hypothetical protein RH981_02115 [Arenibacter sp.]
MKIRTLFYRMAFSLGFKLGMKGYWDLVMWAYSLYGYIRYLNIDAFWTS